MILKNHPELKPDDEEEDKNKKTPNETDDASKTVKGKKNKPGTSEDPVEGKEQEKEDDDSVSDEEINEFFEKEVNDRVSKILKSMGKEPKKKPEPSGKNTKKTGTTSKESNDIREWGIKF